MTRDNHVWIRWDGWSKDDLLAGLYPAELGYSLVAPTPETETTTERER